VKNFGIGLALGLIGVIIIVGVYLLSGFGEAMIDRPMPFYSAVIHFGQVVAIGGVVTFWIILPIVKRVKRHRE